VCERLAGEEKLIASASDVDQIRRRDLSAA